MNESEKGGREKRGRKEEERRKKGGRARKEKEKLTRQTSLIPSISSGFKILPNLSNKLDLFSATDDPSAICNYQINQSSNKRYQ